MPKENKSLVKKKIYNTPEMTLESWDGLKSYSVLRNVSGSDGHNVHNRKI